MLDHKFDGLRHLALIISFNILATQAISKVQTSNLSDHYYIAGVLEFPTLGPYYEPKQAKERIRQFRHFIEDSQFDADIIVFPENALNNRYYPVVVPHPQLHIIPCARTAYDYIITEISCYARSFHMYLLINVIEIENCTSHNGLAGAHCPIYNTNVVFDRDGAIISRYRKYNLIGSEWQYYNYTDQPEQEATFQTDFNVTFGHFTRMDLLYYRPAQALVAKNITNFLHPSKWQSELPFMTAIQLHQSWAFSNNVNLLVAGTNDPLNGRTGTGIYAGRYGTLFASMTTDATKRKLHLSVVPKKYDSDYLNNIAVQRASRMLFQKQRPPNNSSSIQFSHRITGIKLGRDNDIDLYTTFPLPPLKVLNGSESDELQQQICHADLCCSFYIKRTAITNVTAFAANGVTYAIYQYRIAAFKGIGTFLNTEPNAIAVCALFSCVGDHLYTCARIFPEDVTVGNDFQFDYIQIRGNFTRGPKHLVLPLSVNGMLMPFRQDHMKFLLKESGNTSLADLRLLQPKVDVLTFGIYVNYFLDETIYDHHHNKNDAQRLNNYLYASSTLLYIFIIIVLY